MVMKRIDLPSLQSIELGIIYSSDIRDITLEFMIMRSTLLLCIS